MDILVVFVLALLFHMLSLLQLIGFTLMSFPLLTFMLV